MVSATLSSPGVELKDSATLAQQVQRFMEPYDSTPWFHVLQPILHHAEQRSGHFRVSCPS
eukprot:8787297-Prorocentrum_lima.AAC.1